MSILDQAIAQVQADMGRVASANSYATDGKCHNAQAGSFGDECGRSATWIGTKANGFRSGYCDGCKANGHEARAVVAWERIGGAA